MYTTLKSKGTGNKIAIILLLIINAFTVVNLASAITNYPPGSLLQTGDVTSSHIRDNAIVNADVSQTTAFTLSSSTIQTLNVGTFVATSSTKLTATTTFGTKAWHMPQTDGTSGQVMTTDGVGNLSLTTISQPYVSTSFTTGEAITAGQAIAIGDGAIGGVTSAGAGTSYPTTITATTWVASGTTTPSTILGKITAINFGINNTNPSYRGCTCNVEIRNDNAGTPGATVLYSGTQSVASFPSGYSNPTHTLTTPLTLDPSTPFWIVWYNTNGNGDINDSETSGTTNKGYSSTNSGSTWAIKSYNLVSGFTWTSNTAGLAYKASAALADFRFKEFVGFASATTATSSSVTVQNYGWLSLFSGLTIGSTYYLSDTQGSIGTSAGSQSLIVGRGITTTMLMTRNP